MIIDLYHSIESFEVDLLHTDVSVTKDTAGKEDWLYCTDGIFEVSMLFYPEHLPALIALVEALQAKSS